MNQLLAEVALEIAERYPDTEGIATRAQWRHSIITLAKAAIIDGNITEDTLDLDEVVTAYLQSIGD